MAFLWLYLIIAKEIWYRRRPIQPIQQTQPIQPVRLTKITMLKCGGHVDVTAIKCNEHAGKLKNVEIEDGFCNI